MMLDEKMEPAIAKNMIKGEADRLNSAFHLTYNMILNMLRVEGLKPEWMLERCFFQFQNNTSIPQLESEINTLDAEYLSMIIPDEERVRSYVEAQQQLSALQKELKKFLHQPKYIVPFLQPGRLVQVEGHSSEEAGDWGCIINFNEKKERKGGKPVEAKENQSVTILVDVLLPTSLEIISVDLSRVAFLSSIRIYLGKDLPSSQDKRKAALMAIDQVRKRFPKGVPLLDPEDLMISGDEKFTKLMTKIEILQRSTTEGTK